MSGANRARTRRRRQAGQSMVEYTVVLVFGVLVLTTGPGGDVIINLLDVLNDNYRGYSYTISLSDPPDHDTLYHYLNDPDTDIPYNPADLLNELGQYTSFPTLESFPKDMLPKSVGDILDGAISFF
jgi:hypothetical protein